MKVVKIIVFFVITVIALILSFIAAAAIMKSVRNQTFMYYGLLAPIIAVIAMSVIKRYLFSDLRSRVLVISFGLNFLVVLIVYFVAKVLSNINDVQSIAIMLAIVVTLPSFILSVFATMVLVNRDTK